MLQKDWTCEAVPHGEATVILQTFECLQNIDNGPMGEPLMHMCANNVNITIQQPINQNRRIPLQFPDIIVVFDFVGKISYVPTLGNASKSLFS